MKTTLPEKVLVLILIGVCVAWLMDHMLQLNEAVVARHQWSRYSWQADTLAAWIRKQDAVKSIDVIKDTITISRTDGEPEIFTREQ